MPSTNVLLFSLAFFLLFRLKARLLMSKHTLNHILLQLYLVLAPSSILFALKLAERICLPVHHSETIFRIMSTMMVTSSINSFIGTSYGLRLYLTFAYLLGDLHDVSLKFDMYPCFFISFRFTIMVDLFFIWTLKHI